MSFTELTYPDTAFTIGNGINMYLLEQQINAIPSFPTTVSSLFQVNTEVKIFFSASVPNSFQTDVDNVVATHDPDTQFEQEPGVEAVYISQTDSTPKFLLNALNNVGNISFSQIGPPDTNQSVKADIGITGNTGDVLVLNGSGTWSNTGPNVFFDATRQYIDAYSTGTITLPAFGSSITVNINTIRDTVGGNFSLITSGPDVGELTINTTDTFEFIFRVSTNVQSGGTRTATRCFLEISTNGGISFTEILGTSGFMYNRTSADGQGSATVSLIRQVNSGEIYRVRVEEINAPSGNTITTIDGGSSLTVSLIGGVKGNTGPTGVIGALEDLTDVNITTPTCGDIIQYQSNNTWANISLEPRGQFYFDNPNPPTIPNTFTFSINGAVWTGINTNSPDLISANLVDCNFTKGTASLGGIGARLIPQVSGLYYVNYVFSGFSSGLPLIILALFVNGTLNNSSTLRQSYAGNFADFTTNTTFLNLNAGDTVEVRMRVDNTSTTTTTIITALTFNMTIKKISENNCP